MKLPITVVIPAKNEASNLPRCLKALDDSFEDVVVVDSGSTDQTQEIARSFQAGVLDFQWDGKFPKKRNWVLRNYGFKTPWVLFLDADECVTPTFIQELSNRLPNSECGLLGIVSKLVYGTATSTRRYVSQTRALSTGKW